MISEIDTLITTITLAKIGIVKHLIRDFEDLKEIVNKHSVIVNVVDLMEVSYIKILLSNDLLYFLIKYPKLRLECRKLTSVPLEHNGSILHLSEGDCVTEYEKQVLAIGNCSVALTSTFCKELSAPTCEE